jgi:hypothetical protein
VKSVRFTNNERESFEISLNAATQSIVLCIEDSDDPMHSKYVHIETEDIDDFIIALTDFKRQLSESKKKQ